MTETNNISATKAIYVCPTCGERMERDLLLFMQHTDAHILELLKKSHPDWITHDGYCPKCLAHYQAAKRGEKIVVNIAGREVSKRQGMAGISLALSLILSLILIRSGAPHFYRILVFLPLFATALGYVQAKKNHCVVLGMRGVRNMDHGEEPVTNVAEKTRLRQESVRLLVISFFVAAILTVVLHYL